MNDNKIKFTGINLKKNEVYNYDVYTSDFIDQNLYTKANVDTMLANISASLKFDDAPTKDSSNLLSSGTVYSSLSTEASARSTADTTLQTDIQTESDLRKSSDTTLQTNIDAKANDDSVVHLAETETITGTKTFAAPADVASTELDTTWFNTSNGGKIGLGKDSDNNGSSIFIDQTSGTRRLNLSATSTAGAVSWTQPEANSELLFNVSKVNFKYDGGSLFISGNNVYPSVTNTGKLGSPLYNFNHIYVTSNSITHLFPLSGNVIDLIGSSNSNTGYIKFGTDGKTFGYNGTELKHGDYTVLTAENSYIKDNAITINGTTIIPATLVDGKVPSAQLPSYVDDVIEANSFADLPTTGEAGKIYVTLDDNKTYRWSGSAYVEISASLALGETSSTAYAGDKGKAVTDGLASHIANKSNPHSVTKAQIGLGNVENTSDIDKPVSTATQEALNGKFDKTGGTLTGDLVVGNTTISASAGYIKCPEYTSDDTCRMKVSNNHELTIDTTDHNIWFNYADRLNSGVEPTDYYFGTYGNSETQTLANVHAKKFAGDLSGTAANATNDDAGNRISTTYLSKADASSTYLSNAVETFDTASSFSAKYPSTTEHLWRINLNFADASNIFNEYKLIDIFSLYTANVTNMSGMFGSCYSLISVPALNTANVTDMSDMFDSCSSLTSVPAFNTANVTDMNYMFYSCSSLISVPAFNTANVTDMSDMFDSCSSLTSVPALNTANVTNMYSMFYDCSSLTSVPALNTANVTDMSDMFGSCYSLISVPALNTANVTDMNFMFDHCLSLISVPAFNTAKVTSMNYMFYSCSSLISVPALNTANVTDMYGMFQNCPSLTSVPAFNTANVTRMYGMFQNCSSLISVPAFNTANVTNMSYMFQNCPSLTAIHMTGMKTSFDISSSTLFTREALNEIIGNCDTVSSAKTLTMGATNLAKLTADDIAVATGKGWTLA